jgi:transcription initiation factor IIE alpha subunit
MIMFYDYICEPCGVKEELETELKIKYKCPKCGCYMTCIEVEEAEGVGL